MKLYSDKKDSFTLIKENGATYRITKPAGNKFTFKFIGKVNENYRCGKLLKSIPDFIKNVVFQVQELRED